MREFLLSGILFRCCGAVRVWMAPQAGIIPLVDKDLEMASRRKDPSPGGHRRTATQGSPSASSSSRRPPGSRFSHKLWAEAQSIGPSCAERIGRLRPAKGQYLAGRHLDQPFFILLRDQREKFILRSMTIETVL
jgi:hypothetical protein